MAELEDQSSLSVPESGPSNTDPVDYDFISESKGVEIVAVGTTCLVERFADGNIIKTPYPSHHHDTAAELATEARVYQLIGPHPLLVPVVSWDESTHALTLEFMANGTLKDYISTGNAPFHDIESDEVEKRFSACVFPAVDDVLAGDVNTEVLEWAVSHLRARSCQR